MNITESKAFTDEREAGGIEPRELPKECRADCRWKRLYRWQKCACCARNWRNLKDCYEREV